MGNTKQPETKAERGMINELIVFACVRTINVKFGCRGLRFRRRFSNTAASGPFQQFSSARGYADGRRQRSMLEYERSEK